MTMKKNYISPDMQLFQLETQPLMSSSITEVQGDGLTHEIGVGGKAEGGRSDARRVYDDWEEEEDLEEEF
ncbi:MAG: hypothetical protein IJ200_06395 [Prevotella sp.]|nr:hypothetical protein [Prevotella sp.]